MFNLTRYHEYDELSLNQSLSAELRLRPVPDVDGTVRAEDRRVIKRNVGLPANVLRWLICGAAGQGDERRWRRAKRRAQHVERALTFEAVMCMHA